MSNRMRALLLVLFFTFVSPICVAAFTLAQAVWPGVFFSFWLDGVPSPEAGTTFSSPTMVAVPLSSGYIGGMVAYAVTALLLLPVVLRSGRCAWWHAAIAALVAFALYCIVASGALGGVGETWNLVVTAPGIALRILALPMLVVVAGAVLSWAVLRWAGVLRPAHEAVTAAP